LSYHQFYKQFSDRALAFSPGLKSIDEPAWDHLVSPLELRLPKKILSTVEQAVRALYAVSRRSEFQHQLEVIPGIEAKPNKSVLMAYDFHTNEDGDAFLVEVNTNASGFMLASVMDMTHTQIKAEDYAPLEHLRISFLNELGLCQKNQSTPLVAITDEDIPRQRMYLEFLMYRDWFKSFGWGTEFCEASDFRISDGKLLTAQGAKVDFVYNRLTDFYLENPEHAAMREGFVKNLACYSPNPFEYFLLGDKQRLIQLGDLKFLKSAGATDFEVAAIAKVIIPTFDKSHFPSTDEIWQQRRQLFFKPKRSHGGKSVYRGESVSKKVFERLMADDILIQRYQPAQKMPIDDPRSVLENWKFDLRFYVYEDKIHLSVARIYQGQVTNFASPMGGFTQVKFI
jgi:hypothetical protein